MTSGEGIGVLLGIGIGFCVGVVVLAGTSKQKVDYHIIKEFQVVCFTTRSAMDCKPYVDKRPSTVQDEGLAI